MSILGMFLGWPVFFFIYGHKIFDPALWEWTMRGDAATDFLGWHCHRSEPWSFPLCLIKSYQFPQGTSLICTGSIPLLASPLKLISSLAPPNFQYHGLRWLLSYSLLGYMSVLLMRQIKGNPILILLAIPFFLLATVIVERSGWHMALTAHWIIIASLYQYFQRDVWRSKVK
jgi:hypothetical protein